MLQINLAFEGQYFIATRDKNENRWMSVTLDWQSGEELVRVYSDEELGAILALAIAGDFDGGKEVVSPTTERLYEIASPLQDDLDMKFRLIP